MRDEPNPGDWLSDAELTDLLKPGVGEEPHDYLRTPRSERQQLQRLQNYDWWSICKAVAGVLALWAFLIWAISRGQG